jgi:2',3'-cyclic-nucleotide 2'-phosphodiesterase (5'-nucleotidase family)
MNSRLVLSALLLTVASVIPGLSQARPGTLADRVGADDGYALVVNFSADMNGSIDNCGCKSRLMGGIVWRAGYIDALAKATGGQIPILQADAGHAFTDGADDNGTLDERRVRNDYVLRAFASLRLDVANVSPHDLPYLEERMRAADHAKNLARFPALDAFTSANVVPIDAKYKAFKPYVIREVRGARLGAAPVRVGFLGLSETPVTASGPGRDTLSNYRFLNAVDAASRAVSELRSKCDILIVLAYMDKAHAKSLAAAVPGIDAILAANQFGFNASADEAAGTVISYATTQTKWLGELRFYPNPNAPAKPFSNILQRPVPLDAVLPADATAAKLVEESHAAVAKLRSTGSAD